MSFKWNLSLLFLLSLIIISGCAPSGERSMLEKARSYCLDNNGTVKTITLGENNTTEVCITTQEGLYDGGYATYSFICDILDFYKGKCEIGGENEINSTLPESSNQCEGESTQRCVYYNEANNILLNLNNTGYIHRPFLLDTGINGTKNKYDLFLDCSGFVGYYVLQKFSPKLYYKLPLRYSCGPKYKEENVSTPPARPLAADFVNYIKSLKKTATGDNSAKTTDYKQCWGRVENISDALPGDVIAYTHKNNIDTKTKYCCSKKKHITKPGYYYSAKEMSGDDNCSNGRIIYKTKLNKNGKHESTGHVMFIMKKPFRSKKCKDKGQCKYSWLHPSASYQWVVYVADSTNVIHTSDSRKVENSGGAKYKGNSYHSWTEGYLEKCTNGTYHRDCSKHGSTMDKNITVQGSSKPNHPTGIGAGYIYVNDAMDGYRTSYSADISKATIVIARPITCN